MPPLETVTLESPGRRQLRVRWSAVEGTRYDVDLVRVPGLRFARQCVSMLLRCVARRERTGTC